MIIRASVSFSTPITFVYFPYNVKPDGKIKFIELGFVTSRHYYYTCQWFNQCKVFIDGGLVNVYHCGTVNDKAYNWKSEQTESQRIIELIGPDYRTAVKWASGVLKSKKILEN